MQTGTPAAGLGFGFGRGATGIAVAAFRLVAFFFCPGLLSGPTWPKRTKVYGVKVTVAPDDSDETTVTKENRRGAGVVSSSGSRG
jgi:hypothetical protein